MSMDDSRLPLGIAAPDYRLPADTRLGRVTLYVSDLGRSVRFYERVMGFGVIASGGRLAAMGPVGGKGVLVELREQPAARPVPRMGRLGLFHLAFLLPSRADLGRFVRHLATVGVPAGAADHLVSEALYLQDPDGHGLEVYADRPRSAWRRNGREIAMTTDALDVNDLGRASGEAPWRGAPAGTAVGHVHLRVGDLGQAVAFYHEALGLDQVVWSYPGALFLSAGGYHHHLGLNTWGGPLEPARDDEARLAEWRLVLPDAHAVEAAAAGLRQRGLSVDREHRTQDPWGTIVRLATED